MALGRAAVFLRRQIGSRLRLKRVPELEFYYDESIAGQDRIEQLPNARHRSLLRVILGETLEHRRFFEQALAGRSDLLGRRAHGAGTGGGVLAVRWIER